MKLNTNTKIVIEQKQLLNAALIYSHLILKKILRQLVKKSKLKFRGYFITIILLYSKSNVYYIN